MWSDRDAALFPDVDQRIDKWKPRRRQGFHKKCHKVTIFGGDFCAGDDFNPVLGCEFAGFKRTADFIVIGNGDHIQADICGLFENGTYCSGGVV